MNSKFLLILFFIFVLSACGVKAKPLRPPEMAVKSYVETYTGEVVQDEKLKKAEKKK